MSNSSLKNFCAQQHPDPVYTREHPHSIHFYLF